MQKSKQSFSEKVAYWLKVVSLGMILGLGLQFAQAWTAPTIAPPGGNVSGPLTTGSTYQTRTSAFGISAGNDSSAVFGPNATWGGKLVIGSNVGQWIANDTASVISTNGNLHLDGGLGKYTYIEWISQNNTIINGRGGNVGIGTQSPTQKLDVNGKIRMAAQTVAGDAADIVATKGYVDGTVGGGSGGLSSLYAPFNGQTISCTADAFTYSMKVEGNKPYTKLDIGGGNGSTGWILGHFATKGYDQGGNGRTGTAASGLAFPNLVGSWSDFYSPNSSSACTASFAW